MTKDLIRSEVSSTQTPKICIMKIQSSVWVLLLICNVCISDYVPLGPDAEVIVT